MTDELTAGDWEYVATDYNEWFGMPFCTGIIKYTTMAYDSVEGDVIPGEAWGYYATRLPDGLDEEDCDELIQYYQNEEHEKRPGILFMHGNRDRGRLAWAKWIAYSLTRADGEEGDHPFVLSISAPGQGYDCIDPNDPNGHGEDWDTTECQMPPEQERIDQISIGQGMTESPACWHEGFYGYESQIEPEPEHHILWGYATSAMRAINVFKKVFDVVPNDGLGFTNGHLVTGGFSAGGITSLLVHTQDLGDNDPDGFFTLAASGAFDDIAAQEGSALAYLLTMEDYSDPYDPEISIDCPDVRESPENYDLAFERACQAAEYFDPVRYPAPSHAEEIPVLLTAGAQDEVFPVQGFQLTYDHLKDQGTPVFRHYQGDMDHAWYWGLFKIVWDQEHEGYGNIKLTDPGTEYWGLNRMLDSISAFFHLTINGAGTNYPAEPADLTAWRLPGLPRAYRFYSCYDNDPTPNPAPTGQKIYFNISIDGMYHVLPACDDGEGETTPGTYTIYDSDYSYNSACVTYEGDDYVYVKKCNGTWLDPNIDKNDTMYGVSVTGPTGYICRRLDVRFPDAASDAELPRQIAYWTDLRYWNQAAGVHAVASSEVKGILNGIAEPELCIRDKTIDTREAVCRVLGCETEGDKRMAVAEPGACTALYLDYVVEVGDGETLDYSNYELVVAKGGGFAGQGTYVVQTNCDATLLSGSSVSVEDGGNVALMARNIVADGDFSTGGVQGGGSVTLIASGDISASGTLNTGGSDAESRGGSVYLSALGYVDFDGSADATGEMSGGPVTVFGQQGVTISGGILTDATAEPSWGGRVSITTSGDVALVDGAAMSTTGGFHNGGIFIFYGGELVIEDSVQYDEGDLQADSGYYPDAAAAESDRQPNSVSRVW